MIDDPGPVGRRRAMGATVLAVLVAADAVLVGLALHTGSPPRADLSTVSASEPQPVTADPSAPAADAVTAASAVDVWRYAAGCDAAPGLQASTDGGRTWRHLAAPAAHLLRVVATGPAALWAVAADDSCGPAYFDSADGGETWRAGSGLSRAWVLLPGAVQAPGGRSVTPCPDGTADALAPATAAVAVARCGDALRRTDDGGRTWTAASDPVGRTVAVAVGGPGGWLAVQLSAPGCSGLRVDRSADEGRTWTAGPCLGTAAPPVALSVARVGAGVLVSGDAVWDTADGGAHWSAVTG